MSPDFHNALATLTVAFQYFNVVQNEFREMIERGNINLVVWDEQIPNWEEYERKTLYSDFRIMIPTLFCLYQGIELTMKGLLSLNKISYATDKKGHEFTTLYGQITQTADIPNNIKKSLSYFIDPKFANLNAFLKGNNESLDNLSIILRYAVTTKSTKVLNYIDLKYQEQQALPYLKDMLWNLDRLRKDVRVYYKKFEDTERNVIENDV